MSRTRPQCARGGGITLAAVAVAILVTSSLHGVFLAWERGSPRPFFFSEASLHRRPASARLVSAAPSRGRAPSECSGAATWRRRRPTTHGGPDVGRSACAHLCRAVSNSVSSSPRASRPGRAGDGSANLTAPRARRAPGSGNGSRGHDLETPGRIGIVTRGRLPTRPCPGPTRRRQIRQGKPRHTYMTFRCAPHLSVPGHAHAGDGQGGFADINPSEAVGGWRGDWRRNGRAELHAATR